MISLVGGLRVSEERKVEKNKKMGGGRLTFADDLEPVFDLVAVVDGDDAACQQRDGAVDDVRPVQRIRHSVQQQIVEQEKIALKKREGDNKSADSATVQTQESKVYLLGDLAAKLGQFALVNQHSAGLCHIFLIHAATL